MEDCLKKNRQLRDQLGILYDEAEDRRMSTTQYHTGYLPNQKNKILPYIKHILHGSRNFTSHLLVDCITAYLIWGRSQHQDEDDTNADAIMFYAPGGHCKKMLPEARPPSVVHARLVIVNGDARPDLMCKYKVNAFPTSFEPKIKKAVPWRSQARQHRHFC